MEPLDPFNLPIPLSEMQFRAAFNSVMYRVQIDADIRERLFRILYTGTGFHEDLMREYTRILDGQVWTWLDFDEWEAKFRAAVRWPFMWTMLHLDEVLSLRQEPQTVSQALSWFNMQELQTWLDEHGYRPEQLLRRRADLVQYFIDHISWDAIAPAVLDRYAHYHHFNARPWLKNKAKLLAHTVQMALYSEVDRYKYREMSDICRAAGTPFLYHWQMLNSECPIEQELTDLFNRGEIRGYPPFFPGDRSCLQLVKAAG